VITNWWC